MPLDTGKIWDDLLKVRVDLDYKRTPDPRYIQECVFECNKHQRTIEKHFLEVTRELTQAEKLLRVEQLNVEIKKRTVLTNSEKIKKLPTGREREAAVDELLEEDHRRLVDMQNTVDLLHNLLSGINRVQQNLNKTGADIRVLVKVMEQEISRLNLGSPSDPHVQNLMKGLSEVEAMEDDMTLENVESSEETQEPSSGDESTTEAPIEVPSGEDGQDGDALDPSDDASIESFIGDESEDISVSEDNAPDAGEGVEDSPAKPVISKPQAEKKPSVEGDFDLSDIGIEIDAEDSTPSSPTRTVEGPPPKEVKGSPPAKPVDGKGIEKTVTKGIPPSLSKDADIEALLTSLD